MRRSDGSALIAVAVVVLVVLAPAVGWSTVSEGDRPELALTDIDGQQVELQQLRGSVVLIDFWATWCTPCHEALPFYERMLEQYGDQGLEVLAVSIDADADDIREFADELSLTLPLLHDADQQAFARFNPAAMPTTYFVDPDGEVQTVHIGFDGDDRDQLEANIGEMLQDISHQDDEQDGESCH